MNSYWKDHCSYTIPWFTVTISHSVHAPTMPRVACQLHSLNQSYHTPCRVPISLSEFILSRPVPLQYHFVNVPLNVTSIVPES